MIIGICGGTASGKTTFTQKVLERVDSDYIQHMEHDVYYKSKADLPPKIKKTRNFDHPASLDNKMFIKHLKMLMDNKPIEQPIYDFTCDNRKADTITIYPKPIILVEGVLIFSVKKLRQMFDIKVFIDTANDLRLSRRIIRDLHERGRSSDSVINQYLSTVRPMHNKFVETSRQYSDLIISGNTENYVGLDLLVTKINTHIEELKKANT
ncbi:MAG TPA: uridine kinase [Victivallales bacterium]|nr:uridine kinase [Victivallales bacterium]